MRELGSLKQIPEEFIKKLRRSQQTLLKICMPKQDVFVKSLVLGQLKR